MGKGKARRRRQHNYEAAHRTGLELAPPPVMKDVDAIPSKLRAIMKFMDPREGKQPISAGKVENATTVKKDAVGAPSTDQTPADASKPGSKKRRRNTGLDEFAEKLKAENAGGKSRERRKKFLKERKEKKKQKQLDAIDHSLQQLYKHEQVTFGEVAQAPPKLPRLRKKDEDAAGPSLVSQERRRLQAVEAYRMKRDWQSRPGSRLDSNLS
ncbi:coiled-coil domain-containing protein 137-like [Selaginella moellendorffii]|uniref:coiled-coil domain-containing protein 137-like n=1 Tax=Selaginella moellendorffii TaxID=88036 RepID=UPI000D1C69A6|nr:coiled-coil domain-containing protein 137-like [Selaginella moellendorffii]|eukprot:XP_024539042.1 coiled-coil domain-containing protein 137-like [Selaginella moellendorffii]